MLDFIKKIKDKITGNKYGYAHIEPITDDNRVSEIDYSIYPDIEVINPGKDKSLLIIDDKVSSWSIYHEILEDVKVVTGFDAFKELTIYKAIFPECGLSAHKLMENTDIVIDYAMIDLTLEFGIKHVNGRFLEKDGVDVHELLTKRNDNLKAIFVTAHSYSPNNPCMRYYYDKFERLNNTSISSIYVHKSNVEDKIIKTAGLFGYTVTVGDIYNGS